MDFEKAINLGCFFVLPALFSPLWLPPLFALIFYPLWVVGGHLDRWFDLPEFTGITVIILVLLVAGVYLWIRASVVKAKRRRREHRELLIRPETSLGKALREARENPQADARRGL